MKVTTNRQMSLSPCWEEDNSTFDGDFHASVPEDYGITDPNLYYDLHNASFALQGLRPAMTTQPSPHDSGYQAGLNVNQPYGYGPFSTTFGAQCDPNYPSDHIRPALWNPTQNQPTSYPSTGASNQSYMSHSSATQSYPPSFFTHQSTATATTASTITRSTTTNRSRQQRHREWDNIRPAFESYYYDQGLTLNEVMSKLSKEHSLHAT